MDRILLIRMLGLGDVTCIGIPAIRYFKSKFPDAEITVLTFAAGKDILQLAEPGINIIHMEKEAWPDNIIPAMEAFLQLAEPIIGQEYTQIINLDTWFMPCFLARFLKDAGEHVSGNYLSVSIEQLITEFQQQTLSPEYVHDPAQYMSSTFFAMSRWHTPWWEIGNLPDYGYPEFYLRQCCGFGEISMDMSIEVEPNHRLLQVKKKQKVLALATDARTEERGYPYKTELKKLLEDKGYYVWTGFDGSVSMKKTLSQLKASDLLITVPSAPQWLATTVDCPSLVIVGKVDVRTLMPDYATEEADSPIAPEELAEDIDQLLNSSARCS